LIVESVQRFKSDDIRFDAADALRAFERA